MKYIGIDIGKNGGVAIIDEQNNLSLHTIPKIGKEVDLIALFNIINNVTKTDHIVGMENVKALQKVGSTQSFNFGENKGQIEGLLVGMGASYIKVLPQTWQKVCWEGVPIQKKPGKTSNDTKAMSLLAARRLFPKESFLATERSSVPHDGLVDAALIAMYLKIKYNSK
jgi:hypothetical protein